MRGLLSKSTKKTQIWLNVHMKTKRFLQKNLRMSKIYSTFAADKRL